MPTDRHPAALAAAPEYLAETYWASNGTIELVGPLDDNDGHVITYRPFLRNNKPGTNTDTCYLNQTNQGIAVENFDDLVAALTSAAASGEAVALSGFAALKPNSAPGSYRRLCDYVGPNGSVARIEPKLDQAPRRPTDVAPAPIAAAAQAATMAPAPKLSPAVAEQPAPPAGIGLNAYFAAQALLIAAVRNPNANADLDELTDDALEIVAVLHRLAGTVTEAEAPAPTKDATEFLVRPTGQLMLVAPVDGVMPAELIEAVTSFGGKASSSPSGYRFKGSDVAYFYGVPLAKFEDLACDADLAHLVFTPADVGAAA